MSKQAVAEHLMAVLIDLEAGGEPHKGKVAVGWVVRNRKEKPRWWGRTITNVILKPHQFEPIQAAMKRRGLQGLMERTPTEEARWIARGVIHGWLPDPVQGATHFYAPLLIDPPFWAADLLYVCKIGGHRFHIAD